MIITTVMIISSIVITINIELGILPEFMLLPQMFSKGGKNFHTHSNKVFILTH